MYDLKQNTNAFSTETLINKMNMLVSKCKATSQ